jgi:magnesium transporter
MIKALYLDPAGICHRDMDEGQIEAALATKDGLLWVDIPSLNGDGDRLLRETFHFHPLAIEDCANGRIDTPKIDDYGDYLFIIAQSVGYAARTERLELAEVDLFLGPNYVVSLRTGNVATVDELFQNAVANNHLLHRGADFLAHTILDGLVDLILPAVEAMDEDLDRLETQILEKPDKALLGEVLLLKRNTLRLRRSILPQRDMINRLSRGEFGLISGDALIFFRDIYDHIVRVEEMLDGLRDLADSALNSYLSSINNRMNEIMKTLSVVTVVFLPLTLIASIYGTNLNYSAVFGWRLEWGFYLMLGAMLLLAGGLALVFHKRGWF